MGKIYTENEILSRTELLIGEEAMRRMQSVRVIIFGVGGVGGWCAESLVRSGVRHLAIVDSDCISATNINRQLPATTETVGRPKVEILKTRLQAINPYAEITAIKNAYTAETSEMYNLGSYDYIIDAIDSLEHKASLIANATRTKAVFFSSMGAALKLDTSRIRSAEFWEVKGCPLAAALRRRLKKGDMPAKKFLCVYSDEVLENKGSLPAASAASMWDEKKARINGTAVHATAVFGFTIAGLLMQDVVSACEPKSRRLA